VGEPEPLHDRGGRLSSLTILISVLLLLLAFSTAKLDSIKIRSGVEFNYIIQSGKFYKYIGKAGDYYFLTNLKNQETIVKNSTDISEFVYYKYDKSLRTKNDTLISIELKKDN
jgi:hypothetical protein